MDDQYGMGDLRQYMTGRPLFPPPDLLSAHRSLTQAQHYEMVLMGRQVSQDMVPAGSGLHHEFRPDVGAASSGGFCGLEMEGSGLGGGDGGTGRWPRQETLTLLEIRSRLDPKFKEANQKGPLWDEVSRYCVFFCFLFTEYVLLYPNPKSYQLRPIKTFPDFLLKNPNLSVGAVMPLPPFLKHHTHPTYIVIA